jgi:hypothetical protein
VKQIVDLSGGTIDIRSEIGNGTEVKVSLPLECSDESSDAPKELDSSDTDEEVINAVRRRCKDSTVAIRGFDPVQGDSQSRRTTVLASKAVLEKYLVKWFDLEVVPANDSSDIVICDESILLDSSVTGIEAKVIIISCSNSARRDIHTSQLTPQQSLEFVSKPLGPHRLARGLLDCFDTLDARIAEGQDRVSVKTSHTDAPPANLGCDSPSRPVGKSLRLIGKLQLSIGFSPMKNLSNTSADAEPVLPSPLISAVLPARARRPKLTIGSLSTTPSVVNSVAPSLAPTPNQNPTFNALPYLRARNPKMLLVEVGSI